MTKNEATLVTTPVDISVVIGFKDWGTERLLVSVRSVLESFGHLNGEVIVSDYGSSLPSTLKDAVEALGARYVYTQTDGVWSRSRALNAGFAQSSGRVLVSTDADMLFTPHSMAVIGQRILENNNEALILQCRDLPERLSAEAIDPSDFHWQDYADSATLRPRWGMGGMMAVSRGTYLAVRGFDERMEIYGGEDMDFAQRVQRSGNRLTWLDDSRVRMYHIWHPSSRQDVTQTPEGTAAIKFNRDIFLNDKSFVRNVREWKHKPTDAPPLASVVISTRNRAEYIAESIYSVLAQTAKDIELIIIDDGSTDETENVVLSIDDPRIRYFRRKQAGIAASRNYAATVTRGAYTVIHDDDDIMFPDRIENHFRALASGMSGTYGGWIDFQNAEASACTANTGRNFSLSALLFSDKVYAHATLMLQTSLIQALGYDERLRSGSDYNLALRLARSGINLGHTGHFHLIRRLHDKQVTTADATVQKGSARISSTLTLRSIRPGKQKVLRERMKDSAFVKIAGMDNPFQLIEPYLPDHLANRTLRIAPASMARVPALVRESPRFTQVSVSDGRTKNVIASYGELMRAGWEDMASLTAAGVEFALLKGMAEGSRSDEARGATILQTYIDSYFNDMLTSAPDLQQGLLTFTGPPDLLPKLGRKVLADLTATDNKTFSVRTHAYMCSTADLADNLRGELSKLDSAVRAKYICNDSEPRIVMRQLESVSE